MAVDFEPALLRSHVHGHEGNGNVDIEQHAAGLAMHVVMPLDPAVVTAGLVSKGQFLDQPMLRKQVQRAVDRAVSDVRIPPADSLEDLTSGEVQLRLADCRQHRGALGCVLEPLTWHHSTFRHSR